MLSVEYRAGLTAHLVVVLLFIQWGSVSLNRGEGESLPRVQRRSRVRTEAEAPVLWPPDAKS